MKRVEHNEVDRIVARIDETRAAEHFRNPDRPNAKFIRRRRRQDPAIGRAKTRLRTADYRNRLDRRGAPSTAQIGMSLVVALVTANLGDLTEADRGLRRQGAGRPAGAWVLGGGGQGHVASAPESNS